MRFYFNLLSIDEKIVDEEGVEARNIDEAIAQALKAIEELKGEDGTDIGDWGSWSLEVTDAQGTILCSINLGRPLNLH
jgi:dissimilatory sulfite reductase (desulfoviridin) alpha/beta subunit